MVWLTGRATSRQSDIDISNAATQVRAGAGVPAKARPVSLRRPRRRDHVRLMGGWTLSSPK